MVINQWLPAAHTGDAVGDSARHTRRILRRLGHVSDIFALTIDDALAGDVLPFAGPDSARGELTILHYALASPLTEAFAGLRSGRILQYHNITPAHFFAGYDASLCHLAAQGRRDLASLHDRVDLAVGVSEYNRSELTALGFRRTAVMPIVIDLDRLTEAAPSPAVARLLDDGMDNVLFVGRIVPNKRVEDFVRLAADCARVGDRPIRFVFAGRYDVMPRYYSSIRARIAASGVPREQFVFTGPLSDGELAACYRAADAYLSLSEHEGFCVPLVEAMAMDVPVLAYAAAAVPETLGGAGVLFAPKDPGRVAQLLDVLLTDDEVREPVLTGQRRRIAAFNDEATAGRLAALVRVAAGNADSGKTRL